MIRARPPRYSIVVPVYESARSIEQLIERTVAVFEHTIHHSYEIILVDDG